MPAAPDTAYGDAVTSPTDRLSLSGRVAIVTGASRGIGLATAQAMAAVGARVMLTSRKQDALDAAAADIPASATFAAHAGDPEQIEACVAATLDRLGTVDILVNNAATNPYFGPTIDVDLPRYDKIMEVNVRGPLAWTQAVWRSGMSEGGGVVINVSSVGGLRHAGGIGVYDVSKAALLHLTRVLAAELAPTVRVNALAPGLVKTDFARTLWEPDEAGVAARTPLGRIGVPTDIAGAAVFLASDLASWVTGQTFVVDGGALLI